MSTSRSPWKPRSPRSILIVTTGNDYKRKTHKVSEIRRGWGRSCVAAPGGSIYSARRMLSKEFGSDVNSAGAGGYSMGQKSGGLVAVPRCTTAVRRPYAQRWRDGCEMYRSGSDDITR
ncbi:uncharacterized protein LOC119301223 isoform X2 [Triticum dicoccoides]|uniref:uncharacterized protein LOC119301223 isoform X2 n=1 Tax=Triticum dicoccoides TaxID=85692 RepID=UPI000842EE4A|nr:uncharacterized protein LOC119301223 isoform X2 [Triticum dicoccoides]XP_044380959.1 uncharacterized protein LOC123103434 isoform X2 [Triticum aestivum]